jgi:tetratricopeptide (TPR) repeat protein
LVETAPGDVVCERTMLGERNPSQHSVNDDGGVNDGVGGGERASLGHEAAATIATSAAGESASAATHTIDANHDSPNIEQAAAGATAPGAFTGKRWWLLAAVSALLLTALTVAGVYLVTKKPSTVDQLVILTVPSGADISLDSKDYGHSPVKLEQLAIGTYTLTISKEGFETIIETLTVSESGPAVEFKLKPVLPSETANLPAEEQIKRFQQQAEEAFARGYYGLSYEGSALNYAEIILSLDPNSTFASEMRERIRKAEHQSAQSAISRGDFAEAQEIYNFLVQNYPNDEEARAAVAKLESQLSELGAVKVRDLVRKADEALHAGRLAEPFRTSAYYYSKQALAIDRQNDKARQIRNQVRETLAAAGEQAYARGDVEAGIKQLDQVAQLFREDKQIRARLRELQSARVAEAAKPADADARRLRGLDLYLKENFNSAIPDLEFAAVNGRGTQDVLFALARSYMKTGQRDNAESYFRKIKPSGEDAYRSSIAALGDIAFQRGESATAVERWKEARQLGGSALYSVATLDDKIESVEKKQREKAAEPSPLTLQVKHRHGGLLGGSCSGALTINATGVRYDGHHVFASSLVGVRVGITKDEMAIRFEGNSEKFRVGRADAERVRETIARYQRTYSPASK